MPPVKYVPRFGSQLSSSQRTDLGSDQLAASSTPSENGERGKKRNKKKREKAEAPLLKVKFPNLKSRAASPKVTTEAKTSTKWMLKSSSSASTSSALVNGDVLSLTQRSSTQPTNEKEKSKLSVLRTISKMLEENRRIRQRLSALSQAI